MGVSGNFTDLSFDDAREQFKALALEERAKRLAGRGQKPAALTPTASSLPIASSGALSPESTSLGELANTDPRFTKTSQAIKDPYTPEGIMARIDLALYGRATRGVGTASDPIRQRMRSQVMQALAEADKAGKLTPALAEKLIGRFRLDMDKSGIVPKKDVLGTYRTAATQQSLQGAVRDVGPAEATGKIGNIAGDLLTKGAMIAASPATALPFAESPEGKALIGIGQNVGEFVGQAPGMLAEPAFKASEGDFLGAAVDTLSFMLLDGLVRIGLPAAVSAARKIAAGNRALTAEESQAIDQAFAGIRSQYGQRVYDEARSAWESGDLNATFREPGRKPNASKSESPATVHGSVPERPVQSQDPVPAQEGGPGVRQNPDQGTPLQGAQTQEVNAPTEAVPGASPPDMPAPGAEAPQTGGQAPGATGKEPWQMTRQEWLNSATIRDQHGKWAISWEGKNGTPVEVTVTKARAATPEDALSNYHRTEVRDMVGTKAGVPPEVLADYPDLAKKYGTVAPEPPQTGVQGPGATGLTSRQRAHVESIIKASGTTGNLAETHPDLFRAGHDTRNMGQDVLGGGKVALSNTYTPELNGVGLHEAAHALDMAMDVSSPAHNAKDVLWEMAAKGDGGNFDRGFTFGDNGKGKPYQIGFGKMDAGELFTRTYETLVTNPEFGAARPDILKLVDDAARAHNFPTTSEARTLKTGADANAGMARTSVQELGSDGGNVVGREVRGSVRSSQAQEPTVAPEPPQTGVQGPETGNAAFEEAGTPVGGGVKGKRSGVARLIDPLDRILGIGTAVRSAWASRGSHSFDPKGWVVQLVGDTFQNIEHLAPKTGKLISQTLNRALVDAGARTARLVGTVHEAIIANYGKGYATSAEARAALGLDGTHGIVGKVRRGEALTAKESAVWKRVVASTKELGDSAADAGALVERVSGGPPNPRLKGHAVRWATDDGMKSGKVVGFDDKGNVRVSVDGVESTLPAGGRYWTRSVVEDAQYFPDVFKEGVLEALADPSSPEFRQATDHLIAIKKAKDAASAEAIIKSLVYPKATVSTPVSSSLRRPRIGNLLPESFFETDLLKVVDDHVSRASMDVASAKHFGPEYKGLADMLATVPSPTDRSAIGAMVKRAMGGKTDLSGAERAAHGLASVEGKYTALTKLGLNLSSAVNNLGQLMTNIGVHGLKSSWHGLWKVATSKAVRTDIKLSGVNQADFLALQGFADLTGPVKTVMHVAMTPFRILDSFARNTGAWAGLVAAKDAVRKVSVSGGKFKADASYRYLRDVMKFSDGDIARMKTEGMTDLDRFQAFQGGQSAQIGGRVADLPAAQHTPLGKMALRLQTFNIGQSKWLNYTLREAARGNAVPLGRLAVSSVIAGEGILQARGLIEQWARGKENEEPKKLEAAYQAFLRGDYAPVAERAMADISRSGVAGIYGVPIEAAARPWAKDSFQPPAARTLFNVVVDSSLYAEKTEGDFVAKVKAYFGNLSFKEVVALQNVWRATHGGKTFRQSNPLPDTDKKKEKK